MVICFILICPVSLTLQSSIYMTIKNECSDIELTSLAHFIKDTACHIQFPQQVNPESKMKVNFITGTDRDRFGGVLLYHLQRKENTSIQLLVIWGYKSERIYLDAWLVEHESALVWDKGKLKMLYDRCNIKYGLYYKLNAWLLDDNTKLKTWCTSSHGGFKMEITISEERYASTFQKPLWIDSNR
jgi:hypothetical protein